MNHLKAATRVTLAWLLVSWAEGIWAFPAATQIILPDDAYQSRTTLIDFSTAPDASYLDKVSNASVTATFQIGTSAAGVSSFLQKFRSNLPVDDPSWDGWSVAPESEASDPTGVPLLYTNQPLAGGSNPIFTSFTWLEIGFSRPLQVFGVEIEPDIDGPLNFSMTFFREGTEIGDIVRLAVEGDAGARLLAASVEGGFDSVRIQSVFAGNGDGNTSFAIAYLRYAVPSPGTLALLCLGLAGVRMTQRRTRKPTIPG